MDTNTRQLPPGGESPASPCSAFRVRVTRISVLPHTEPLYSEQCTNVSIEDEAAGEFLAIEQLGGSTDADSHTIRLEPREWPALKAAIETLLADINSANDQALRSAPTADVERRKESEL